MKSHDQIPLVHEETNTIVRGSFVRSIVRPDPDTGVPVSVVSFFAGDDDYGNENVCLFLTLPTHTHTPTHLLFIASKQE